VLELRFLQELYVEASCCNCAQAVATPLGYNNAFISPIDPMAAMNKETLIAKKQRLSNQGLS
jgi:hypothetical protein